MTVARCSWNSDWIVRTAAVLLGCLLGFVYEAVADDTIHQRGGGPTLIGRIMSMNDDGITLHRSGVADASAIVTIPWDRVREVQTDVREMRLEIYMPQVAEPLWRSRTRLERGDHVLAEPGFERLFARYRGQTSETALIVAEGLLRCRIARLANDTAVEPMLEVIRLRRAGVETATYSGLAPVYDGEMQLCPDVPPVWSDPRTLRRLQQELHQYDGMGDEYIVHLRNLYLLAVQRALGEEVTVDYNAVPRQAGLPLLSRWLQAGDSRANIRQQGRQRLQQLREVLPDWTHDWCAFATGESLLMEEDLTQRLQGMVQLATLPAGKSNYHHYLTGLALHVLGLALERTGNSDAAAAMRDLLAEQYPTHPVRRLSDLTSQPASHTPGFTHA